MDFRTLLSIIQIVLAALLTTAILLQQRGAGLGSAFGGEGNVFASRRGAERILFILTIVFAVLFFGAAIAQLIIR
jgi:protein translocase SecG subunit